MSDPRRTPIRMFTQTKDAPPLDWDWVEQRLTDAPEYWLVTTSAAGGQPGPRPVWGVWSGDHLLLTVGSATHWRNVRAGNERVAVHLPDAHEVLIVEGRASPVTDRAKLEALVDVYNPKYGWNFEPGEPGPVIRVDPDVVLAWTVAPNAEAKESPFPLAAGRWVYTAG